MATIYRCDRCGHEERSTLQMGHADVTPPNERAEESHDLCASCTRQLQHWLKEAPPTAAPRG